MQQLKKMWNTQEESSENEAQLNGKLSKKAFQYDAQRQRRNMDEQWQASHEDPCSQ